MGIFVFFKRKKVEILKDDVYVSDEFYGMKTKIIFFLWGTAD